jgi:hypothetical protein
MTDFAIVDTIPACDIPNCGEKAAFDGKTVYGPWAYMCESHFADVGVGLGTGKGQRLVVRKPPASELLG